MHALPLPVVFLAATLPASSVWAQDAQRAPPPQPFATAAIHVERNATDDDTEIVIEAVGGDEGLCRFLVLGPDGRLIVNFRNFDKTVMGQREFQVESPEPPGDAILAAYPVGEYRFRGRTCEGERFESSARLSHRLPSPTVITSPPADTEVSPDGLVIEWSAVPGIAEYILELENESADPEQTLTVNLPAGTTRFEVLRSLVASGADYQVGIATVAKNGNVVFSEIQFTTAEE
jgi:hypothetical protein